MSKSMNTALTLTLALAAGTAHADVVAPASLPEGDRVVASVSGADAEFTARTTGTKGWYTDSGAAWTAWDNIPITITQDLEASENGYRLGITAKNFRGPLPNNYQNFKIDVFVDGTKLTRMNIAASDSEWNTGWADLGDVSGETEVTLRWKNDAYRAGVYDANLGIGAVHFAAPLTIPAPATLAGVAGLFAIAGYRRRPLD